MLYVFRVDIGETYTFETDFAFKDVKTLKSTIQNEHRIPVLKQILLINGGELLDDDAEQVCMKTRETCAGIEENPIYLLDKSYLEQSRPHQIPSISSNIETIDQTTVDQWTSMPPTYETIVERAKITQRFHKYAQQIIENCDKFIRDQQAQYQGWMAVIANIDDTLSSFLLNQNSFDRLYQSYLTERNSYVELFQSLPESIGILHQLKLPSKLLCLIDNSNLISHRSTISTSTSSSSISVEPTTSTHQSSPTQDNDIQNQGDITLFEWITAQLGNMKIDDIINGCSRVIEECNDELLNSMNAEIDDLQTKISNNELKRLVGIEGRFAFIQNELTTAKRLQIEQKDCADYLLSQQQKFSSNVGNQRDRALLKELNIIHAKNLVEIANRHQKLIDIEKKIRQSKQEIINELHRRFKTLMSLQRCLVDHDAKQSLYIHKINRTKKTMTFLKQLNQTPFLYYSFLFECVRRKQYSNIFNQFSQTIYQESKGVFKDELIKREQFVKQYEPHFLFNLLPGLKSLPTFFIKEPLCLMDTHLPDLNLTELDDLFEEFPSIKQENSSIAMIDPSINLSSLIRCIERFRNENQDKTTTVPLSVFIPSTTTIVNSTITKQLRSPTNSSSKSTVVHSQSSSEDVESTNEQKEEKINEEEEEEEQTKNDLSPKTPTDSSTTNTTSGQGGGEEDDDYIQCSLETVYTSTEMALSPPTRPSVSQQTDNQHIQQIIEQFRFLKEQILETKQIQHESITNYHQTIVKVITSLEQVNIEHEKHVEQLTNDLNNLNQDYEALKIQNEIGEQTKQELTTKLSNLEKEFDDFRRQQDIETSQIVKALQSDYEFELERIRSEHQETIEKLTTKQTSTKTIDIQTDFKEVLDKQTSMIIFSNRDQSTQTDSTEFIHQAIQTSQDSNDEFMRRSINQNHQTQFNSAIQRAVQNATILQKKQIGQLEEQLQDKRIKITKLKECVKKLQNFYTLSSTSPPPSSNILPSVNPSLLTTSVEDETNSNSQDQSTTTTTNRQSFLKRSEPISMPSTFIMQSMLAAGNTTNPVSSSPKTEQAQSIAVTHLLMDSCFKNSPNDSSAAVEIYTPFAASPPNQIVTPTNMSSSSPQTTLPLNSNLNSTIQSRISTTNSPQPIPIAFFSVNRSDHVIIYFDQTYQHFMVYTCLPTLHFIHSDCYELFHIPQKQNSSLQQQQQQQNLNSSILDSSSNDIQNMSPLVNTSMINSTLFGTSGFNPSTTPLLGQVTDKEYCQAKKTNNRFNVPIGTKFYRVRVKPWKPSASSSTSTN